MKGLNIFVSRSFFLVEQERNDADGIEMIVLRKGKDEEDDQRRQIVLADMLKFLDSR